MEETPTTQEVPEINEDMPETPIERTSRESDVNVPSEQNDAHTAPEAAHLTINAQSGISAVDRAYGRT